MTEDGRVEHLLLGGQNRGGNAPTSIRADTLRCGRCKEWKADEEFYRCASSPLRRGRHSTCKACNANDKREWRAARARGDRPKRARWTREEIVEAVRLWVITYGEPPRYGDWRADERNPEKHARLKRLRGRVPSSSTVTSRFGSFAEAIRAAGHEPMSS